MQFISDRYRRAIAPMLWVLGVVMIGVGFQSAKAAPKATKINWSPCYQQFGPNFQCATVNVPLDYTRHQGAAVQLAVVRLLASGPGPKIGSILLNPGGPGGSGVDFALFFGPLAGFFWGTEVAGSFDIVGFDPRGVGRSTGVRCFGNEWQALQVFAPFPFPLTSEQERIQASGDALLAHQCDKRGSKIGEHMSTANVARDMDRIRKALGEDELNFVGLSYGSYLGNVYANLFPDNVRAVVIDGVLDPIAWANKEGQIPFSTRLNSSKGAQDTLNAFFDFCIAAAPGKCAFAEGSSTAEELADRFDAIAQSLLVKPLDLGDGFVVTYQLLIAVTLSVLYDPSVYHFLAADLAFLEFALGAGGALEVPLSFQHGGFVNKRGFPNYQNFAEAFPGVACSDSKNPTDYDVWSTEGANADLTSYFGRIWTWASSPCAQWPLEDTSRYDGEYNAYTANPVLIIGNLYDPATPYEGAQAARLLLPNSILLTVAYPGHTSLGLSLCANFITGQYLLDPTSVPWADNFVCPGLIDGENPFDFFGFGVSADVAESARLNSEVRAKLLAQIAYGPRH